MENAISAKLANCQRLRVIFEGVRRWLRTLVAHAQFLAFLGLRILLNQHEVGIRSELMDGARHNITCNPQMLGESRVAHPMQLFDGDVIALRFLYPRICEVSEGNDDQSDSGAKF